MFVTPIDFSLLAFSSCQLSCADLAGMWLEGYTGLHSRTRNTHCIFKFQSESWVQFNHPFELLSPLKVETYRMQSGQAFHRYGNVVKLHVNYYLVSPMSSYGSLDLGSLLQQLCLHGDHFLNSRTRT